MDIMLLYHSNVCYHVPSAIDVSYTFDFDKQNTAHKNLTFNIESLQLLFNFSAIVKIDVKVLDENWIFLTFFGQLSSFPFCFGKKLLHSRFMTDI